LTDQNNELSYIDQQYLNDPNFAIERAVVETLQSVDEMMVDAFNFSGLTHQNLADRLGVPISRIKEIEERRGDVNITTFARWMRACGYVIELGLQKETIDEKGKPHRVPFERPRVGRSRGA